MYIYHKCLPNMYAYCHDFFVPLGEEGEGTDEEDVGDEGTNEEEAEPAEQYTKFGPRWANFVRSLIE